MSLIVTAPALLPSDTMRTQSHPWSGTNWYAMTILRTDVHREVHGE